MTDALPNLEGLLREALAPVEPPADLVERVESTLTAITELAADELEAWELSAMRDPRNWVRPAAAIVVGGAAGAALVVLRARRRTQAAPAPLGFAGRRSIAPPPSGRSRICACRRAGCSATAERRRAEPRRGGRRRPRCS